jgi:adenine deaminase
MHNKVFTISGNIVDVLEERIVPATLHIASGKIVRIVREPKMLDTFITPGLVDAHVHIESSMFSPTEFARVAVTHGTVAAVCDPHEIANVLGVEGIDYMLKNVRKSPFVFAFGAPSCVPATPFETSGASIGTQEVEELLHRKEITHLSEMMNYPGVIGRDPDVMAKIESAKRYEKPIDGHAPRLRGDTLKSYAAAGITTDHETTSVEEAREKIGLGMKILIREGSAAKDFENLHSLIDHHYDMCMFCSDDKHADDLVNSHIEAMVRRAIAYGHDPLKVLRCACLNPAKHYGLSVGLLGKGDPADFLVVDNLEDFTVLKTYIRGTCVADLGESLLAYMRPEIVNRFNASMKQSDDFIMSTQDGPANIIEAADGSLITGRHREVPKAINGRVVSDTRRDILKIAVVNRYFDSRPSLGFVRGFGLKKGAIASSVAHDSHNIIAIGATDEDMCNAVNAIIKHRGGLAVVYDETCHILPLPIAGLMSDEEAWQVASRYTELQKFARKLGSTMNAPFITLSFMALLVIPHLKMSDKGLFDPDLFSFIPLYEHLSPLQ